MERSVRPSMPRLFRSRYAARPATPHSGVPLTETQEADPIETEEPGLMPMPTPKWSECGAYTGYRGYIAPHGYCIVQPLSECRGGVGNGTEGQRYAPGGSRSCMVVAGCRRG